MLAESYRRGLPKRRKTSGVRDFPAGCGTKQAPAINSSLRKIPGSTRTSGLTAFVDSMSGNSATRKTLGLQYSTTHQKETYSLLISGQSQSQRYEGDLQIGSSGPVLYLYPQTPGLVDACFIRMKVQETLQRFRYLFRHLSQQGETKGGHRRVDYEASKILKAEGRYINTGNNILGHVPGIEVGDTFCYMVELNMVGLHRLPQGGIDYLRVGDRILATSVVSSGNYGDSRSSDVLMYTGQGGNVVGRNKKAEDQKLERGNLALANSKAARTPVRVILGRPIEKDFIYDGLYLVDDFRRERGPHGKLVFKFKLLKMKDQTGRTEAITGGKT